MMKSKYWNLDTVSIPLKIVFILDNVLCISDRSQTHYVAKADFELPIMQVLLLNIGITAI